jgi:toxin YhaV
MIMSPQQWEAYFFRKFLQTYLRLKTDVERLKAVDPHNYAQRFKPKLLKQLQKVIKDVIADPLDPDYLLKGPLRGWRRVKKRGLSNRYRLFFIVFMQEKEIVFVWLNDETTLRKQGSSSDVYRAFESIVNKGEIPKERDSLISASNKCDKKELDPESPPEREE